MKSLRIKGITKNKPMTMTPIKIGSRVYRGGVVEMTMLLLNVWM